MSFFCYIVECADGSYYTGWTTDPVRRERQHNRGMGARYTRTHGPVHLVYVETQPDRKTAMRRELSLKKLSHTQKRALAQKYIPSGDRVMLPDFVPNATHISTAPGRVNLLGEHVDYNDGMVLPAAIDRSVRLYARPRPDRLVTLRALDLNETVTFSLDAPDCQDGCARKAAAFVGALPGRRWPGRCRKKAWRPPAFRPLSSPTCRSAPG